MSLNNLGNRQSEVGQREAALASAAEAVRIYEELAKRNPKAFQPDLAMSLNNLGIRQSEAGQREAALASAAEAFDPRSPGGRELVVPSSTPARLAGTLR
ncbi:tetratricopeptide repeat protein [Nannocystis sp. SCPEA4]|uniref:tetratricopeptide repeat protein n=1 Tax=Nannocystis sp. SCPEA4 TaxID=2996787 RepID=UPI00226E542E|nr:tetratricopeptide repeat protein [Nannocystis sp. SCPEA4]MCY1060018.1 tetratricopeptide repeat protein [Nannocystis sp. SCPEA4]